MYIFRKKTVFGNICLLRPCQINIISYYSALSTDSF